MINSYMVGRIIGFFVNAFSVTRVAKHLLQKKVKGYKLVLYTFAISSLFDITAVLLITGTLSGVTYIPFIFLFLLFDLYLAKKQKLN